MQYVLIHMAYHYEYVSATPVLLLLCVCKFDQRLAKLRQYLVPTEATWVPGSMSIHPACALC